MLEILLTKIKGEKKKLPRSQRWDHIKKFKLLLNKDTINKIKRQMRNEEKICIIHITKNYCDT